MKFIELRKALGDYTVFSLSDIYKADPGFHRRRLNEWQEKGYIKKIIKGYYIFSDLKIDENALFEIANRIFNPSYVSLESALSYYGLIPETVYTITSVTSIKTRNYNTSISNFIYHKIKPCLLFGFKIVSYNNKAFKIASIEKALLDFFYFHNDYNDFDSFESLRLNNNIYKTRVDDSTLLKFLGRFQNRRLENRVHKFMEYMNND